MTTTRIVPARPSQLLRQLRPSEALVGVIWLLAVLAPLMIQPYYVRLVTLAGIMALLALSLNLVYGYAGQISFGHGGFYAIGAYGAALGAVHLGLGFVAGLLIVPLASALVAMLVGYPILRLRGHFLALGTLAFALLVWAVLRKWVDVTGGPSGIGLDAPEAFGIKLSLTAYHLIALVIVLGAYLLVRNLIDSKVGWAFRAVGIDERGAAAIGISAMRYKVLAFTMAGYLAGVAGVLYAYLDQYLAPETFSLNASIVILTMVVVGGVGSSAGAVIGAVVLSALPHILEPVQEYEHVVYGGLLLLFLLLLPGGLVKLIPGHWKGS